MKWDALDPANHTIIVCGSKTDAGSRVIPLKDEAWAAVTAMKLRADALKSYNLESYMFPR